MEEPEEATIVGTYESSALEWPKGTGDMFPASMLVDGLALDGIWIEKDGKWTEGCASTHGKGIQWFSLELETTRYVTKVQIAKRMDSCCRKQGQKISIPIGSSKGHDPNDPLCLPEIPELKHEAGLVDYVCNPGQEGKFVTISSPEHYMTLCEVKVFVVHAQTSTVNP